MAKKGKSKSKNIKTIVAALGGSSSKAPNTQDDSGFSKSIAYVVEVLSEGRIQGLIGDDPRKSVFLDDTPIVSGNNKSNFTGVTLQSRTGTQYQNIIPNTDSIDFESNVGTEIKRNIPISRQIFNNQIDQVRIRLGIQMQRQENDGDVVGSSITFRVSIKEGSNPYEIRMERTIKEKYSQLTEFEYQFPVNTVGGTVSQFLVKVDKLTADSTDSKLQSILRFQTITEVIKAKLAYPNTALVAMQFYAEQFSSVPARSFRIGGVIVRIPSNATVRADGSLAFSGTWDGGFTTPAIAVNDPVWQLYHLLTNRRFGLGIYIDANRIDKWSLYNCSVYNNQLISDGLGGVEPRYQCSTVIQTKAKAYEVINALCSSCNMKPYAAEGTIYFWQDRPGSIIQQFTNSDVENGDFVYSSTAIRSRFTSVNVTWNNPEDNYKQAIEVVENNQALINGNIRETDHVAYGCVSRGQAIRTGKWVLFSAQNETKTITFTARAYSAFLRPGDLFQVADKNIANVRYGGLMAENTTTTQVELDAAIPYEAGGTISVLLNNGQVETRPAIAFANPTKIIYPTPAFSSLPTPESNWVLSTPNVRPQIFRALIIKPRNGDPTKVDITGIIHIPEKYDNIENGLQLPVIPISSKISPVVNVPTALIGSITTIGNNIYTLRCDWNPPIVTTQGDPNQGLNDPYISSYYVEYKRGIDGVYQGTKIVQSSETVFENIIPGTYYYRVAAIDVTGKSSSWVESGAIS